jgi:uncharacterized protein (DUF1330 family)
MSAYVIADLSWADPEARRDYAAAAVGVLAGYGGRYLVRGGTPDRLEGEWAPAAIALIEFPSRQAAERWYDSDEYRPLKSLRVDGARTSAVLVDGADPGDRQRRPAT